MAHATNRGMRSGITMLLIASLLPLQSRAEAAVRRPDLEMRSLPATEDRSSGQITAREAARKPDLVVSKLGAAPDVAAIDKPFRLATTVANKGKGKAGVSTVRYYASFDKVRDKQDVRLGGAMKVGPLAPGASEKKRVRVTLPETTPIDDVFILACADAANTIAEANEKNNCSSSSSPVSVTPSLTSLDLIARDLQQGLITPDQAAIYKMQAAYGFPAPPARYQVDGEERLDAGHVVKEVAEQWDSLSLASQQELAPYFSPPIYEGAFMSSGWDASGSRRSAARSAQAGDAMCYGGIQDYPIEADTWSYIDTEHFRFWYYAVPDLSPNGAAAGFNADPEGSRALAETLAGFAEHVYQKETELFGRVPLSDASQMCNGGDGRIDVYAANLSSAAAAQVQPYLPGSIFRPGWMFIGPGYANTTTKARDVFAHEFAHVIQLAYDYADVPNREFNYGWLEEATSNWAVDYVYPEDNFEHQFARDYLLEYGFNNPLNVKAGYYSPGTQSGSNGYEDYLFLFFVTRRAGDPLIMRSIWDKTETLNSVKAIDQAIPGGFSEQWPEFAEYNINRGGEDYYKDWDKLNWGFDLTGATQPRVDVDLKGKNSRKILMPGDRNRSVMQLATEYTIFEFPDAKVRHVTFQDYGFRDQEPAQALYQDVQAWIELENGETRVEDWNDGEDVSFCRDDPDGNIKRLVILYSNGVPNDQNAGENQVEVFFPETQEAAVKARGACGFPTRWTGTASGQAVFDGLTETWSASYVMDATYLDEDFGMAMYRVTSGQMEWQISGTDSKGCSWQGSASFTLHGNMTIHDSVELQEYYFRLGPGEPQQVPINVTCRTASFVEEEPPFHLISDAAQAYYQPYTSGQTALSGQVAYSSAHSEDAGYDIPVNFTWDMSGS